MTCRDCGHDKPIVRARRCEPCLKEYNRKRRRDWYEKNREHALAYSKRYSADNPESRRAYHNRNRDRRLAQAREWKARNREHVNEAARNWYWNNVNRARRTALVNSMAKRAAKRGVVGSVTLAQLDARVEFYGRKCYMCGGSYETMDHVKPLAAGGAHIPANLRPACRRCNAKKKDHWPYAPVLGRVA